MAQSKKQDKKLDRSRDGPPSWSRVFKVSVLIIAAGGAIYGAQQVEQFLIRDPRFILTPSVEYGEESPALHVQGIRNASRNQVLRIFQQDIGRSVYLFPLAERRKALLRIPWIKEASITRTWPNHISVRIIERQPAAFLQVRSDGISRWSLIDQEGVILDLPARTAFNLPVVSGLDPDESPFMRGTRMRRMLRMLDELGNERSRISEADVSDLDNLKVTLKVDQRAVVLMLGDHNFGTRFQNFLDHYQDIEKRIASLSVLDLRLDDRITVTGARRD